MNLIKCAAALLVMAMMPAAVPAGAEQAEVSSAQSMSEADFWAIVDRSKRPDRLANIDALRANLGELSADDLVRFQATLEAQMRRSYRWDLWGAAYLALGGASDDGFEYFRLWLISQGREVFEGVLKDPDSLVAVVRDDPEESEFEELAYVASEIWSEKTGKASHAMPVVVVDLDPSGNPSPAGEPFSEDEEAMARNYPALWKRFGTSAQ